MFSLPQAIPAPPGDYQAATSYKSDTATQAFPTLQTVTAPETFRQRGDWGFKRYFPLRSTAKTSTPYLRVKQVDSMEHVTDFASAADHTLSLEKWQEMNIAITLPHLIPEGPTASIANMDIRPESVFEDKYDFTALDSDKKLQAGQMRWKYGGPWLANLPEGEFQKYIKNVVRPRKPEFRQFLREQLAARLTQDAKDHATAEGGDEAIQAVKVVQPGDITEEQLTDLLRELHKDRRGLFDLVGKFLDLAPIEPPRDATPTDVLGDLSPGQRRTLDKENPYALYGPPITHPSAGLSYLRTTAYIDNHPAYGPLRYHPPVKGRVFVSSSDVTNIGKSGTLGVGGFVVGSKQINQEYRNTATRTFDPSAKGGQKLWAQIYSAQVNSQGRVLLNAEEAENSARMVQEEMVGEKRLFQQAAGESNGVPRVPLRDFKGPSSSPRLSSRNQRYTDAKFTPGTREGYGLSSAGQQRGGADIRP